MALLLTEQSIAAMSPTANALVDGRNLARDKALTNVARSEDGSLVFGFCQGSRGSPYEVSADLAGDKPLTRCSCPARPKPCKHAIALLTEYAQQGASLPVAPPPADLLEQRAQAAAKAAPKPKASEGKPNARAASKSAFVKKAKEQSEALETLESFLVDLVVGGLGGLTDKTIAGLETQTKRMIDANMNRTAGVLTRLSAMLSNEIDDEDEDEDEEAAKAVARGFSEEKEKRVAWMVTQLYTTVRRGKKALEGRFVEEGTTQSEADAQLESILGRAWKLPQLKEAGYWVHERRYVELAHEYYDDEVTEFVTAMGQLLDLEDGSIVSEITALPYQALPFSKLRASRQGTLLVAEAALYPGDIVNRRVRWDDKVEGVVRERPREPFDYEVLHRHAKSIDHALKALRNQIKNPLHPLEGVFLLAAKRFGTIGSELVLEDEAGARLVLRDPKDARLSTTGTLRRAAAAFGPGSLAVRLYFDLMARVVYGEPLALFVGEEHLRLRAR